MKTSVYPKVIDCPARGSGKDSLDAVAKNGIQLKVKARVTVRTNLNQVIGGAMEETIIARVGEGIVSAIGSAETHMDVLAQPDRISKAVLARRLDSQTAFEIVSIDIADIMVGDNIGARLQADRAEADMRVARAKAEDAAPWRWRWSRKTSPPIEESRSRTGGGRGRGAQGHCRGVSGRRAGHPRLLQAAKYPSRHRNAPQHFRRHHDIDADITSMFRVPSFEFRVAAATVLNSKPRNSRLGTMTSYLLAAAWDDFFKILPFIIVVLVWVINQFAGKLQPPQPPKRVPPFKPPVPPPAQQAAPPGQQPLQAEIEEFLRQAQAMRAGRPVPPRNQPVAGPPPVAPQATPGGASRRPRPPRRTPQSGTKPTSQRPPPSLPVPEASTAQSPDRPRNRSRNMSPSISIVPSSPSVPVRSAISIRKQTSSKSTCSACSIATSAN